MALAHGIADKRVVDAINTLLAGNTSEDAAVAANTAAIATHTAAIATITGALGALKLVAAPASAAAAGTAGSIAFASGFFYVCVANNTWQRVAIATW